MGLPVIARKSEAQNSNTESGDCGSRSGIGFAVKNHLLFEITNNSV